jgi:flagellar hook-associated protein 3 FlgL
MSMRVVYNSIYADGISAIQQAADSLVDAQRQISSGRRIGTVSDDPLGSASAILEHTAMSRIDAYAGAADAAAYRLNLADSALSDIINQLTSAQTATLSARGSAQTQAQRDAAAQEVLAIRHALVGDINTKFQGSYIFSGAQADLPPFVESGPTISAYQGDAVSTSIDVANGTTAMISFDGGQLFQGSDPQHILDALGSLATALQANDEPGIQAGLAAITQTFSRATNLQASVGNDLRALEDAQQRNARDRTGVTARLQTIEDADLAEAAAKLAQSDTAYKAALQSLSLIARVSLMDYLR